MRRRLGAVSTMVLLCIVAIGLIGTPAGAQSQQVFLCSYSVEPTSLPAGGGFITIEGTGPGASVVRIFADGVLVAVTSSAPVTGAFSAQVFVTGTVEIAVALDDYPNTPCIGVGGSEVDRGGGSGSGSGSGSGIAVRGSSLARTGSSGTAALVSLGVVALGVGLALLVAIRRRHESRGSA